MDSNKKYFVFISYNWQDEEWAIWLRHELEHYHLPASFNDRTNGRDNLREVFRDRDVLNAGPEWDKQVEPILEETNNLIVICSPHAKESDAVEQEIKTFIDLGKENHIFPFIVEGNKPEDTFPPSLKHSKLGGDVNKDGRDAAFIKIVAGMLNLEFPRLYNRYELEKAEQERKEREQKEKLQTAVGRFVGEKAMKLIEDGDSYLAAAVILEMYNSGMGLLTPEVEKALRMSLSKDTAILKDESPVLYAAISPNGELLASLSSSHKGIIMPNGIRASACSLKLWNLNNGVLIDEILIPNPIIEGEIRLYFIANGEKIIHSSYLGFTTRYTHNLKEVILPKWHWERPKVLKHIPYYKGFIIDSEERFAVVGLNWGIHIIDLNTNEEICNIDDKSIPSFGEKILSSLSISPNGEVLFSFYNSDEIWLWNWQENKCVNILKCQCKYIQYSNDGNSLLIVYENGAIDIRNSKQPYNLIRRVSDNSNDYSFINYSLDDKQVLLGERVTEEKEKCAVYVYDIASGKKESVSKHKGDVNCIVQSRSGEQVISTSLDRTIRLCNQKRRQNTIAKKEIANGENHFTYFPDGETIITATIKQPYLTLQFRDALNLEKKPIEDYQLVAWHIDSMTISPDGKTLFFTDEFNHKAYLIDLVHFRDELYQGNRNENFVGIAYKSEDDVSYRIFRNEKKDSIIVKSVKGSIIQEIEASHVFNCFSVDPQCRFLATCSPEGYITVHTLGQKEKVSLSKAPNYGVMCFSPDGKFFIGPFDEHTLGIWETNTWKLLHNRIQATKHFIDCSPDNRYLIGCSNGKEISIWDISSGVAVDSVKVKGYVKSVKFNPDGKSFAVLLNDGTLLIYRWLCVDELIDNANNRFSERKVSEKEKKHFYIE